MEAFVTLDDDSVEQAYVEDAIKISVDGPRVRSALARRLSRQRRRNMMEAEAFGVFGRRHSAPPMYGSSEWIVRPLAVFLLPLFATNFPLLSWRPLAHLPTPFLLFE